jgi:hypothetical protein
MINLVSTMQFHKLELTVHALSPHHLRTPPRDPPVHVANRSQGHGAKPSPPHMSPIHHSQTYKCRKIYTLNVL